MENHKDKKIYYGNEVLDLLCNNWYYVSVFINDKKTTKKKAINILKNNVSKSSQIVGREVVRKLPFYKGDYDNYRRYDGSSYINSIKRLHKIKLYIDILD